MVLCYPCVYLKELFYDPMFNHHIEKFNKKIHHHKSTGSIEMESHVKQRKKQLISNFKTGLYSGICFVLFIIVFLYFFTSTTLNQRIVIISILSFFYYSIFSAWMIFTGIDELRKDPIDPIALAKIDYVTSEKVSSKFVGVTITRDSPSSSLLNGGNNNEIIRKNK